MDTKTLEALRGSIAKWEGIVRGEIEDEAQYNCPLCQMFYFRPKELACIGCPVMDATGLQFCRQTPYRIYADRGRTKEDAQDEVDFLKSLLPTLAEGPGGK